MKEATPTTQPPIGLTRWDEFWNPEKEAMQKVGDMSFQDLMRITGVKDLGYEVPQGQEVDRRSFVGQVLSGLVLAMENECMQAVGGGEKHFEVENNLMVKQCQNVRLQFHLG